VGYCTIPMWPSCKKSSTVATPEDPKSDVLPPLARVPAGTGWTAGRGLPSQQRSQLGTERERGREGERERREGEKEREREIEKKEERSRGRETE
jgi:hypothetical protein